jgi:hypothetical protein
MQQVLKSGLLWISEEWRRSCGIIPAMKWVARPNTSHKPIYTRWWFWVLVAAGVAATWQAVLYFQWEGDMTKYQIRNQVADSYWQLLQKKESDLEASYKADTYGGETPEETLRFFIDALEKKDYELASKYFVVEEQKYNLEHSPEGETSGSFSKLVQAYKTGKVEILKSEDGQQAELNVYPKGDKIGFLFRAKLNPFTEKWKLTDK